MQITTIENAWHGLTSNSSANFLCCTKNFANAFNTKPRTYSSLTTSQKEGSHTLSEIQAIYLNYVTNKLKDLGYDITPRCSKFDVLQVEVAWNGIRLLAANLRFDMKDASLHLENAIGLHEIHREVVPGVKVPLPSAQKSFNDLMWVTLEAASQLVARVTGSLQGDGSHDWFQKTLPDAEDVRFGNTINIDFTGEPRASSNLGLDLDAEAVLKEARDNSNSWEYAELATDPEKLNQAWIDKEAGRDYDMKISRLALFNSLASRKMQTVFGLQHPGWNGSSGSIDRRKMLDSLQPILKLTLDPEITTQSVESPDTDDLCFDETFNDIFTSLESTHQPKIKRLML